MATRKPQSGAAQRDTSKVAKVIDAAIDDSAKPTRKIGKNKDPRYHRQLLYIPHNVAAKLKREAFDGDLDMSDIVTALLVKRYKMSASEVLSDI